MTTESATGAADERDPPFRSASGLTLWFALPGAVQGGIVYLVGDALGDGRESLSLVFVLAAALIAPTAFWLVTTSADRRRSALFAAALGSSLGALVVWSAARFGEVDLWRTGTYPWPLACVAAVGIAFVASPFRQGLARWRHGRAGAPGTATGATVPLYASLFAHAWNQGAAGLLGGAFAVAAVLLAVLCVQLFSIIGLDLDTWVLRPEVLLPVSGAAFASAVGVVRERGSVMLATRQLLLALLRVLLPFQLVVTGGFVVAVAMLGVDSIDTDLSVTAVLLVSIALSLSLCSAWIGDGTGRPGGSGGRNAVDEVDAGGVGAGREGTRGEIGGADGVDDARTGGAGALACRALAFLTLPLALLAAGTLWPRVVAYGWTHDRVFAAIVVAVALFHGAGYAVAAARASWFVRFLQGTNVAGAALAMLLAALSLTPVLDGYRIGASSQLERLASGTVEPADIDLGWLKFRAGREGREALAALSRSPAAETPPLAEALAEIAVIEDAATYERNRPGRLLSRRLAERIAEGSFEIARLSGGELDGTADVETEEVASVMGALASASSVDPYCLDEGLRCVLLLTDEAFFPGGGRVALLAMALPESWADDAALQLLWLRRRDDGTAWTHPYERDDRAWPMVDHVELDPAVRETLLDALARGAPPVRTIERRGLAVGGLEILPGSSWPSDRVVERAADVPMSPSIPDDAQRSMPPMQR